jgi:hypothetical protein
MTNDMNPEARSRFEELLKTEPNSLTESDLDFLRARSSYLSEEQTKMLDKYLNAKKEEAQENTPDGTPSYNSMTKAEIQDELGKRDIEYDASATKADLVTLLTDSDGKE